jgi:hypothetical protein
MPSSCRRWGYEWTEKAVKIEYTLNMANKNAPKREVKKPKKKKG